MSDGTENATRARIMPGANGGTLMRGRPPNNRTSFAATKKIVWEMLVAAVPEAITRLVQMLRSDDERVAAVAAAQILDRVLGKPSDQPQGQDDAAQSFDLSHLTPDQHIELAAALDTVVRLTGLGNAREIDGTAEC